MDSTFYLMQVVGNGDAVIGDYFSRPASASAGGAARSLRGFDAIRQPARPGAAHVLLESEPTDDYGMSQSPDGRWMVYTSQRTGRPEVYVRDVRDDGGVWQISTSGGEEPRWAPDGREILYRYGTRLFAAAVERAQTFRAGRPRLIVEGARDSCGVELAGGCRARCRAVMRGVQRNSLAARGDQAVRVRATSAVRCGDCPRRRRGHRRHHRSRHHRRREAPGASLR